MGELSVRQAKLFLEASVGFKLRRIDDGCNTIQDGTELFLRKEEGADFVDLDDCQLPFRTRLKRRRNTEVGLWFRL